jgi:beta-lactamase superfamily II metal-dependent hydrolase
MSKQVTIRMYNVGFGDAFLVLIPHGGSHRRILFDCGSIEAADQTMGEVVDRIVRDVTDPDGVPRIDVVVATHRHKDHVSGFGQAAWADVEVKEVWMPWTEHPTDENAREIREIQSRLAVALDAALTARAAGLAPAALTELGRYQGIVTNALMLSNEKAMKTLHGGFAGQPHRRFLPELEEDDAAKVQRVLTTDALPSVRIHVLGPSRDREVIRDMNPPNGESYLRLNAMRSGPGGLPPAPFAPEFRLPSYQSQGTLPDSDLPVIEQAGGLSDLAVAVALDKAVNGTSLMLMLEIGGSFFLFPGDAQWGTWQAVMQDPQWRDLLTRIAFYKIGHHGSHNATPRDFVETTMPGGILAMASTLTRDIWPDIPRSQLLTGLATREAKVARSDRPASAPFTVDAGVVEAHIPL